MGVGGWSKAIRTSATRIASIGALRTNLSDGAHEHVLGALPPSPLMRLNACAPMGGKPALGDGPHEGNRYKLINPNVRKQNFK